MWDEEVDDCLWTLKSFLDWFVTKKIMEMFLTALYSDNNRLYLNEDSDDAISSCNEMGILSIDFNEINLSGTNYAENDPEIVINIKLLAWYSKFEKHKAPKKELNE